MEAKQSNSSYGIPVIGYSIASLVISAVPFYGYRVSANEFDQWVFLVFLGCWLLTLAISVSALIIAIVMRKKLGPYSIPLALLALALAVIGFFGFGGVKRAFFEMVAG